MTPSQISALIEQHGLRPSKALGQNFLADTNMAEHIVRLAGVQPGDRVVEVGPGLGSLTLALCDAGATVRAVELDHRLAAVLAEVVDGKPVEIVEADALTVDWSELLAVGDRWIMVSNLPYNVATPVVLRALEHAPMIERFLVMVQREVGERLAAVPGTKAYGAVSVKVAYYAHAEVVGSVPATVFVPKPKVLSALVKLERREPPPVADPDPERCSRSCAPASPRGARCCAACWRPSSDRTPTRRCGSRGSTHRLGPRRWSCRSGRRSRTSPRPARRRSAAWMPTRSSRCRWRSSGGAPTATTTSTRSSCAVSEPHDEVILRPAIETSVTVAGAHAAGVPTDDDQPRGARRAGARYRTSRSSCARGSRTGAGLGGGSADAAAVLLGAPVLGGFEVAPADLDRVAVALGADVPVCLRGAGATRVRGIGGDLEPVTLPSFAVVIATPPFGCETAAVYRAWDTLGGPVGETVEIDGLPPLRNDLERAAHTVEPRLAAFKVLLEHAAGVPAILAGSGSSYALLFATDEGAEAARARVAEVVEGQIVIGRTVGAGVRLAT